MGCNLGQIACEARVRYDVQRAEAYQEALASLLQQHFIPFIQHELDVDLLATKLVACMISAAKSTTTQVCKRSGVCSRKQQAWFDSRCKEALAQKEAVYNKPAEHCNTEIDRRKDVSLCD